MSNAVKVEEHESSAKPINRIGSAKKMRYQFWEAPKMNIGISILTTISANIGLKWYYRVQVMGYFVDFVPYKHLENSKLSKKYLKSLKLCKTDISQISVSNWKFRIGLQKPISPSTTWIYYIWYVANEVYKNICDHNVNWPVSLPLVRRAEQIQADWTPIGYKLAGHAKPSIMLLCYNSFLSTFVT